jgi:hypothetical protein
VPCRVTCCWEREPGRLQLRVVRAAQEHVDEVLVAEDENIVTVLVTICTPADGPSGDRIDEPHHVYLQRPLGSRKVIDGVSGEEMTIIDAAVVWGRPNAEPS